jgi:hypothetical protein
MAASQVVANRDITEEQRKSAATENQHRCIEHEAPPWMFDVLHRPSPDRARAKFPGFQQMLRAASKSDTRFLAAS